ncbi:hypothetical protein GJ496_000566 [Pomphorhynchus laevis]|nr:hypothetical protein GJ496_000566 [Pomphorhynchus laevis]
MHRRRTYKQKSRLMRDRIETLELENTKFRKEIEELKLKLEQIERDNKPIDTGIYVNSTANDHRGLTDIISTDIPSNESNYKVECLRLKRQLELHQENTEAFRTFLFQGRKSDWESSKGDRICKVSNLLEEVNHEIQKRRKE